MKKTQHFNISRLLSFIHALSATLTLMSFWWWGLTGDVPPIFAWGAESRAIGSGGCVVQIIHRNHYVFTRSPPSQSLSEATFLFVLLCSLQQHDSSVESSLTIESVTLSDSGIYKCTSDAASEAQVAVLVTSGELPVLLPLELRG